MVKNLFIASEVRSGSTWIAELIAYQLQHQQTHMAFGLTKEVFSYLQDTTTIDQLIGDFDSMWRDGQGLASAKLMCAALSIVTRNATQSAAVHARFFGEATRWIVVRRRDRIAQSVSLAFARNTNAYHSYSANDDADPGAALPDLLDVQRALQAVSVSDIYLHAFARRLPAWQVLEVDYESVLERPAELLAAVHRLCGWPLPADVDMVDRSKLIPTAGDLKRSVQQRFEDWFLSSYHSPVESSDGATAPDETSESLAADTSTTDELAVHDDHAARLSAGPKPRSVAASWPAWQRLDALMATARMDAPAREAWCSAHRIQPQDLARWRDCATQALQFG